MNLEIIRFVFQIITASFVIYLTVVAVKFAAKPKLRIRYSKMGKGN